MQRNKWQRFLDRIRYSIPSSNLISDAQLVDLEAGLLEESRLSLNYVVLVIGSAGIATTGLIADSTAVIIGAMIIAPLMLPIRGTVLGVLTGYLTLIRRGTQSILVGTLLGIGVAFFLDIMIQSGSFGNEILSRTRPNTLDLIVALLAGAIGTFARCRPSIADSLAGVAVAVALMPPLCVVGIGLAEGDWRISGGALLLYATNLIGIALACHIVFFVVGYTPDRARSWLSWGAISAFGQLVFIALVMLAPLSASRFAFLAQDRFETLITTILTEETETFKETTLLESNFNWQTDPPSANLLVLSQESFTSKQVWLLEQYIKDRTGRTVELDIKVIPVL